jgi:hypothetical protein
VRPTQCGVALALGTATLVSSTDVAAYRVQRVCEELMTKQGKTEKCRTVLVRDGTPSPGQPNGGGTGADEQKPGDHTKGKAAKH